MIDFDEIQFFSVIIEPISPKFERQEQPQQQQGTRRLRRHTRRHSHPEAKSDASTRTTLYSDHTTSGIGLEAL